jgi:hypothetical protein
MLVIDELAWKTASFEQTEGCRCTQPTGVILRRQEP